MALLAGEAPVDRESDLPDLLAVDLERGHPLGHHRDAADLAARRAHDDLAAVGDPLLLGERLRHLDEESRLDLVELAAGVVLGPVVEVLGEPVDRKSTRLNSSHAN